MGQGTRAVTVPVTSAGTVVPIITAPCRLKGWSLSATGQPATEIDGSFTSPGAGQVICSTASLPVGDYSVAWSVSLEGTVAAAVDNDNFQLRANAGTAATSLNLGAVGDYPQQTQTIRLTSAGTFVIRAAILGTVGAIYRAQVVATPVAPAQALVLDSQQTLGVMGAQFGFSDTEFLDEEGIYVSTGISVSVIQGTVSGVVYVKDFIDPEDL